MTFAPGRTFTMCLACDAALRIAPETRDPGTALAADDAAGYPLAERAADRRAALTAALTTLEDEWRTGRWGRFVGLAGRRYVDDRGGTTWFRDRLPARMRPSPSERFEGTRFGCFIPELLFSSAIALGSLGVVAFTIVNAARHGVRWADVKVGLFALALLVLFAYFVRVSIGEQWAAVTAYRSERSAYLARRAALRAALGRPPHPPAAPTRRGDDGPRLV
ncbi:MAG: hypothetical protein U0470_04425 [Anaerolineae bacterium]